MSPRTPKQFEEIRGEKRALIMDTALLLFANRGYYSTTIDHIAKQAGISKGLLYNYFESKEALLKAIIRRSAAEAFDYFDINHDGYLSEEEFEIFVRRTATLLTEKQSFWRLLFQLLMQTEVRGMFIDLFTGPDDIISPVTESGRGLNAREIMKIIYDYFTRKNKGRNDGPDPLLEMNVFITTLKGFAITSVYSDDNDVENNGRIINRIIELFK